MKTDALLADYEGCLIRLADRYLSRQHAMYDDLIAEGRIAMWDEIQLGHGDHAGYMRQRARSRMTALLGGHKAFGNPKIGRSYDVKPATSFEAVAVVAPGLELTPEQTDLAERAMVAYHRGEIRQAVDRLPAGQKSAVIQLMTDGALTDTQRASLSQAKRKLAIELDHLRGLL